MIPTHGLTHISLKVASLERSVEFYSKLFGVVEYFRDDQSVQVKGPGPNDVIAPGYPFAYIADPDGYEIEIWYE